MNLKELVLRVESITLKNDGDPKEVDAADFVHSTIPEYEKFWRLYVFPYRDEANGAFLNLELPRDHEAMCIYNYSTFRTVGWISHLKSEATDYYDKNHEIKTEHFDDCMIYIKIGYTQMKHFFGATYSCFKGLDASILINEWETFWNILDPPANLEQLFDEIKGEEGKIKKYRNYIIHAAKFPGYENMIPKPEYVDKMIYWSDFHRALLDDKDGTVRKLVDRYVFMNDAIERFIKLANKLWKTLYDENMGIAGDKPPINEKIIQKRLLSPDIDGDQAGHLQDMSASAGRPSSNRPTTASGTTGDSRIT